MAILIFCHFFKKIPCKNIIQWHTQIVYSCLFYFFLNENIFLLFNLFFIILKQLFYFISAFFK